MNETEAQARSRILRSAIFALMAAIQKVDRWPTTTDKEKA